MKGRGNLMPKGVIIIQQKLAKDYCGNSIPILIDGRILFFFPLKFTLYTFYFKFSSLQGI